jgi:ABC-type amino acid transport substrate-binding protein
MNKSIHFWNGNKSSIRQEYELDLIKLVLAECDFPFANTFIKDDRTDYPKAVDEGNIFRKGADVCVTVAGNSKFVQGDFIPIYMPLMYGLLGHRLLVIREADAELFAAIKSPKALSKLVAGVPDTWADANILRANQLKVNETGTLDTIFSVLKDGECDYLAFGANEITAIFESQPNVSGLVLEQTLRLYYPMALVFYVAPENEDLATALSAGLNKINATGKLNHLFQSYFSNCLPAGWNKRKTLGIDNPQLPEPLIDVMRQQKIS